MFQKYADALNLMDLVIAVKDDSEAACVAWDNLYTFVYPNFVCPVSGHEDGQRLSESVNLAEFEAEVEEMVVMFGKNRETLEEELRKIPPVIAEVAFPVYMARHLLRDHRVQIDPSKLSTFSVFRNRYGYMVVNGARV